MEVVSHFFTLFNNASFKLAENNKDPSNQNTSTYFKVNVNMFLEFSMMDHLLLNITKRELIKRI